MMGIYDVKVTMVNGVACITPDAGCEYCRQCEIAGIGEGGCPCEWHGWDCQNPHWMNKSDRLCDLEGWEGA